MKKFRLLIILLLCIFLVVCNKGTTNNSVENDKVNKELKNTISFAIKGDNKLVALTSDGKEVKEFYTFSCDDFKDIIDNCNTYTLGGINNLVKVSNDSLWLEFGNEMDAIFTYVTFNLNTKKLTKVNSAETYKAIQYVY